MEHRIQQSIPVVTAGCDIPERQNSEQLIGFLAAASALYGRAKRLMAFQFIVTVPTALVVSLLMAWRPEWKGWLSFFSISVALLDLLWLSRAQANLKKRGATLQQMFDCALFQLPWHLLRCGKPVDSEDVFALANAQLRKPEARADLVDWYPQEVGALSLPLARLVCQRASLWWDRQQRHRVRSSLIAVLTVLAIVIWLIALIRGNTVEEMIRTVCMPLVPAVIWTLREIFAQREAIDADVRGLAYVESIWIQALGGSLADSALTEQSLIVQDSLFDARARGPLIFNWVYRLVRNTQQRQMQHKAKELVSEALMRFGSTKSPNDGNKPTAVA